MVGLVLMVGFRHSHGDTNMLAVLSYLVLKLTSGQEYPLFAPGRFFPGREQPGHGRGWRQRLQEYLAA